MDLVDIKTKGQLNDEPATYQVSESEEISEGEDEEEHRALLRKLGAYRLLQEESILVVREMTKALKGTKHWDMIGEIEGQKDKAKNDEIEAFYKDGEKEFHKYVKENIKARDKANVTFDQNGELM